jgi:hypothetical protein
MCFSSRQRIHGRSMTFKRPAAGLSNPDAADGQAASLNLALCSCKSGANEAR